MSPADFEDLARDLIGRELGVRFEAFGPGPDGGIDGRHASAEGATILQAKHYRLSDFAALARVMRRERKSIDALGPARYVLVTSRPLLPDNKDILAEIVGPALGSLDDILGCEDVNGLLRQHPEVVKSHVKLWLSSAAVLERVLHAASHNFTTLTERDIRAKLKVYAENPSLKSGRDILEKQRMLIVSGPPGVGKTTLAEMLCYAYLGEEWELISIRNLEEGFARIDDAKRQVFFFDDFLGRIERYEDTRNFPAVKGPSYLSVHLRFGTISPRLLARTAHRLMREGNPGATTWLSELVWRDFYFQILHHHPHVVGQSFKPAYDAIAWETGPEADALFAAWCEGRTGYPLVDAAMAQINQTGYMHNRLRMVVASFLVKDLGIDWRRGEAYFATHLNDFDLAANNGGWQWASSSGCDAQPYFRIFNPVSQSEKFDPEGKFIRRYLPQLAALPTKALHAPWLARPLELQEAGVRLGDTYPLPVVEHDAARQRTLERYAVVKTAAG